MESYKSRWGFHPADYNTFLKLKRLHAAYWEGRRMIARHRRWEAKLPENRRSPEPVLPEGYFDDPKIVVLYHQCRIPSPEPVTPFHSTVHDKINLMYGQLEKVAQAA